MSRTLLVAVGDEGSDRHFRRRHFVDFVSLELIGVQGGVNGEDGEGNSNMDAQLSLAKILPQSL